MKLEDFLSTCESFLQFGKGWRSIILKVKKDGKLYAVKVAKSEEYINKIKREFTILSYVNRYNIGPKVETEGNNFFVYEFLDGERLCDLIGKDFPVFDVYKKILLDCRTLDILRISKEEMQHPSKNIIVKKPNYEPVLIDFERAHFSNKPKNVSGFFSFVIKKDNCQKYSEQIRKYKKTYSDEDFSRLFDIFRAYMSSKSFI